MAQRSSTPEPGIACKTLKSLQIVNQNPALQRFGITAFLRPHLVGLGMSITRIIAIAVIAGTMGLPALHAQTLKRAQPPAEVPPLSYKGKQYVDSRGCIYIRAGIDGNVTWVPRVNRARKQICGFKPTGVLPGSTRKAQTAQPELITLDTPATAAPKVVKPAPKVVKVQKPRPATVTTPRRTTKPVPTVASTLPAAPAPRQTTPVVITPRATAPAPTVRSSGNCAGGSSVSAQYINKSPDVRCGPQAESPVTFGDGSGIGPQSSLRLTPHTRVVPRHVYDNRQNTQNVEVPAGYKTAWNDDRLNPDRTERGLRPAVISSVPQVPYGFRTVERGDDRLNPMRGVRTPSGDQQSAQIWSDTLPRTLRPVPTDAQVITLPPSSRKSPAEADTRLIRISTKSAPDAQVMRQAPAYRYVRVATYNDDATARQAARSLAGGGLPMRLGAMQRNGRTYKVVLAGPFNSVSDANQALAKARAAGFGNAKLSK